MERIIYGKNPVCELLKEAPNKIAKICFLKNLKEKNFFRFILNLAKNKEIQVEEVEENYFKEKFGKFTHQGIVAYAYEFIYSNLEDSLEKIKKKKALPFLLLLDQIQDPQNLGSLIRTAEIFGVDAVIIPKRRAAQVSATVTKVSAGAVEILPIIQVVNLVNTIHKLKKAGFWIVGADTGGEKFCFEVDFKIPLVLVFGSEGQGITRLVKENCDLLVRIPQGGKIPSLNVGVAGGIIMFEVFKQRNKLGTHPI